MSFSRWLARELASEGLNQSEAGDRFGVSHTTVKRWLDGASPTLDNLKAVAKALHIDLEDLVAAIDRPITAEAPMDDENRMRIRGLVNDVYWTDERAFIVSRLLKGYIDFDEKGRSQ